jgi:hypothetical protein
MSCEALPGGVRAGQPFVYIYRVIDRLIIGAFGGNRQGEREHSILTVASQPSMRTRASLRREAFFNWLKKF